MKSLYSIKSSTIAVLVASLCIAGSSVWAADTAPTAPAAPTKEQRAQMAAAHDKMAACLRSDKMIADCRQEMMQSCQALGGQACNMMGQGMMGQGSMMHGQGGPGMPGGAPAPAPKP